MMLSIGAVEMDTGISKDVLRKWEQRYGFPKPIRDDKGERCFAPADVARLGAIKRLMDNGLRPGSIVGLSIGELAAMAEARAAVHPAKIVEDSAHDILALLRSHDESALRHAFAHLLMRQGLQRFVLETITPLNAKIGDAWIRGELQIFEEHLYSEQLQAALRTAISALPRQPAGPRVLLTTFPTEQHGLGLLMAEAMMVTEGAHCISLGTQMPMGEILRAAEAHRADVVALSFSAAFPLRQGVEGLAALRRGLPPRVALWAGGELTGRIRRPLAGVVLIPSLPAILEALGAWRSSQVAGER